MPRACAILAAIVPPLLAAPAPARADDTAAIPSRPGRHKVFLFPLDSKTQSDPTRKNEITLGDWTYRAEPSRAPADGVPWHLVVTPAPNISDQWKPGLENARLPGLAAESIDSKLQQVVRPDAAPVIEVPDVLWRSWLGPEFKDVVGIHFHEMVADDYARILFTLHPVAAPDPPGATDGAPAEPEIIGTRIEATLLTPLAYHLDQTLLARDDPLDKTRVKSRGAHELAHAEVSQLVFLEVLKGPQNWDPDARSGRRSQITYYWSRQQIGRSWRGLRGRASKVAALRTSIVLVPPTRWSMLLPVPPERVTQKQIQRFNDSLVLIGDAFAAADRAAQEHLHATHGAYE